MGREITFFDSNVLIAAFAQNHTHHILSYACIERLHRGGGACATHTLAETYNTLTKHPKVYGMTPADVLPILEYASKTYELISLTLQETLQAIEGVVRKGLTGPIVYDALLVACARKIDARLIYTKNVKHFRQIAPDLAARILEP